MMYKIPPEGGAILDIITRLKIEGIIVGMTLNLNIYAVLDVYKKFNGTFEPVAVFRIGLFIVFLAFCIYWIRTDHKKTL